MQIALFGGSFNPPHYGHVLAAHYALLRYPIDEVWILPVYQHPYEKTLTSFDQRLAWCQQAFAHLKNVVVDDIERDNHGGRTATLLDLLCHRHPRHHFHLLGGSDTRDDIGNWYRGQELQQRLPVLVVPRGGFDHDPLSLPAISSSLVRQRLAQGEAIDDLVPHAIRNEIGRDLSS